MGTQERSLGKGLRLAAHVMVRDACIRTQSLTQSLTQSVTHSLSQSLIHSVSQSFTHSLSQSVIHSLILLLCLLAVLNFARFTQVLHTYMYGSDDAMQERLLIQVWYAQCDSGSLHYR